MKRLFLVLAACLLVTGCNTNNNKNSSDNGNKDNPADLIVPGTSIALTKDNLGYYLYSGGHYSYSQDEPGTIYSEW